VFHGETIKVETWFAPEVAEYIKEKRWHESQEIIEQEDGSIIFKNENFVFQSQSFKYC